MSIAELFGWGTILVALLVAFVLGAAPVFAVRLIAAIYPKHHPRRREMIAESVHVKKGLLHIGEQWRWLGGNVWPRGGRTNSFALEVGSV